MDQTPPDDQPPQPPVSSTSLAALAASSSVLGGVAGLAGGSIASPPPLSSGMQSPLSPNTNGGGNGGGSNRKETILSLVEMLLAEGATNKNTAQGKAHVQAPSFEDDRDVPSVDEHLQAAGAEMFHNFQRSCNALDKELRNFANASRQLGSSVAILASGFHLRERLAQLLYLYRENAADLFPRKVSHANIIRAETVPLPSATIPNTGATSSGAGDGDADNSPIRNLSANSAAGIGLVPGGSRSRRSAFDNNVPRRSHSHRAHNTNFYSRHRRMRGKAHLHIPRPTVTENLDPEDFPEQLEMLAKDVKTFLNCLNEFPEFTDEAVNASILSFEGDLRYWASCLREYSGQFRYPAVQRYIHELTAEIGEHLDTITSSLCMFIEVGVPTIRFAQKHGSSNLLNLSTIATFFSAVTATTMQFSFELNDSPVAEAVNCFWFSSLVFSIGAAVNSLLGLTWKQAMYRSPGHRVPWWVLIWIKRSPLVFLVLSVACFSIGLCLFAYASDQAPITSTVTTVMTAFTSFGLAAVSMWFASERWAFSRHRGQKWLSDVLTESMDEFIRLPGINLIHKAIEFFGWHLVKLRRLVAELGRSLADLWNSISWTCGAGSTCICGAGGSRLRWGMRRRGDEEDDSSTIGDAENGYGNATMPHGRDRERAFSPEPKSPMRFSGETIVPTAAGSAVVLASQVVTAPVAPTPVNSPTSLTGDRAPTPAGDGLTTMAPVVPAVPSPPTRGKLLWGNAVRTIKIHQQASAATSGDAGGPSGSGGSSFPFGIGAASALNNANKASDANAPDPKTPTRKSTMPAAPEPIAVAKSRIASLVPKLAGMEATQDISAHTALVRHIQFSPDGRFLATSGWDRTSVIFRVGDPFVSHKTLPHTQGFVGQVAWSPTGNILLTKFPRGIKIWVVDASSPDLLPFDPAKICTKLINRNVAVETLTWMPDGQSFLSVEESTVTKLNLQGRVVDQYDFGRIKLHDVAVTPDSLRLVGVGPLLESPTGLQPSKSRVEKRLVVFNLETKQVESQVPVLNDVRDITIAQNIRDDWIALVSYENKAPPQLWKIELVRDRENGTGTIARLTLRHTYMPKISVDFAGPSYFGGKNNELVLCPGKAGDIHIWDQESGALLHLIRGQAHGGDMTCLAWNHGTDDPFMFATGSHDGGVRIWTRTEQEPSEPELAIQDYQSSLHGGIGYGVGYGVGNGSRNQSATLLSRFRYDMTRTESPEDAMSIHSTAASVRERDRERGLERDYNGIRRPRALSISSSGSSKL